jgi:hypothetical protein
VFDAIDGIVGLPNSSNVPDNSWIGLAGKIYQDDGTDNALPGAFITHGLITAVNTSSGDVTIKTLGNPASATFAAAQPLDNSIFIVTHSLSGAGTFAPEAGSDQLEVVWNTTSIIETAVEVDGDLAEAALRGYSNELARLRLEKMKEQKMKINKSYYHGMRPTGIGGTAYGASDTDDSTFALSPVTDAGGKPVRTGMGVIPALIRYGRSDITHSQQNIFSINAATYKYDKFVDDTTKIFQYVPSAGVLYGFCDSRMLAFWSKISVGGFLGNSKMKVMLSQPFMDGIGLKVQELITPRGTVRLIFDPALDTEPKGSMVIVDPAHVGRVTFRKTRMKFDVKKDNDYDGVKDNIRSDEGPWLDMLEKHSYWTLD